MDYIVSLNISGILRYQVDFQVFNAAPDDFDDDYDLDDY